MKLGTLKSIVSLDGELVVVSQDNRSYVKAGHIAPSLREALENWEKCSGELTKLYKDLNSGQATGVTPVDETKFHSPQPRSFAWADGSAFIHHIKLVRMSRNAPLPETLSTVP